MRPRSDSADTNSEQPPPQEEGKWEQPGPRDCKPDKICNVAHDHPPGFSFSNRHQVLDIYEMKLTRNKHFKHMYSSFKGMLTNLSSYKGYLSGLICNHDLSCRDVLYLYKVKPEDATQYLDFDQQDHYSITLNGPQGNNHLVDGRSAKSLYIALLLGNQSLIRLPSSPARSLTDSQVFREQRVGFANVGFVPLMYTDTQEYFYNRLNSRSVMYPFRLPIDIDIDYAIMYPGAVANITIQILNKPTHVYSIHGAISARPCSFTRRIPLISKDEITLFSSDSTIQLKRRLLVVPSLASLVIEVGPLTDQDVKDLISYIGATFVPSIDGSEVQTFKNDGGDEHLTLKIKWQKPME